MIPVQFPEANAVVARNQDEYEPLPSYHFGDAQGRVAMCFRLSPAELAEIARTKTLWIQQLTFNRPFQPIALSTQRPDDLPRHAPSKTRQARTVACELDDALNLANRLLEEPNADPDDDLRVLSRHLTRQFESHERYKKALQTANGFLIQHGLEPVKLEYSRDNKAGGI